MAGSVYSERFREFSHKLAVAISCRLNDAAGELNARSLISLPMKIEATNSTDAQKTAAKIVNELQRALNNHDNPETFLNEVCTALKNVGEKEITTVVDKLGSKEKKPAKRQKLDFTKESGAGCAGYNGYSSQYNSASVGDTMATPDPVSSDDTMSAVPAVVVAVSGGPAAGSSSSTPGTAGSTAPPRPSDPRLAVTPGPSGVHPPPVTHPSGATPAPASPGPGDFLRLLNAAVESGIERGVDRVLRASAASTSPVSAGPSPASSTIPLPPPVSPLSEPCRKFNKGYCKHIKCKYSHVCSSCLSSEHVASACPKAPPVKPES